MGKLGVLFGRKGRRALVLAVAAAAHAAAPAAAQEFAPVDQPGPKLSVSEDKLADSLRCGGPLEGSMSEPVLLVPGTTVTPEKNFSWNWIPAFNASGRPWCTVELPGSSMEDIQVAGEYVVNAIRKMHARAGGEIDVLGHSQGGMVPRWALRFWPDVRAMVDDQVGIAPSNHGTELAGPLCALGGCAPAIWQQRSNSNFIRALNSRQETFDGIDYTAIYTITDTVVVPNLDDSGSSALRPGGGGRISNVRLQDVCPTDVSEHLAAGTVSNTAYRLALDAFDNPGPAVESRIPGSVCLSPLMPGVNPATVAADLADAALHLSTTLATFPHIPAEPELACYTTASCPPEGAAEGQRSARKKRKCARRKKGKPKAAALSAKKRKCKRRGAKKRAEAH
jgi:hypothetical protein